MKLVLTTPWNPGMNDPGKTYPVIYITQMTDNRASGNFQFIYEAGDFVTVETHPTNEASEVVTVWQKGAGMTAQVATVDGEDYIAAINAQPLVETDSAYASIIRLLYTKIVQGGLAGSITDT